LGQFFENGINLTEDANYKILNPCK